MKKVLFAFLLPPLFGSAQIIKTVAGDGSLLYLGDSASATAASFYYPMGVAVDGFGNLYISDALNSVVRKVNTSGIITTIAGNGTAGFSGDGGAANLAQLNAPGCLAVDVINNLYIADAGNARIRKVDVFGNISTFAGGGGSYAEGIDPTDYSLSGPTGIAFDGSGNMYLSDGGRIHKITVAAIITTIAGNDNMGFSGDGGPATDALFNNPAGLTVDEAGNLFIADVDNFRVRVINTSGTISTFAGNGDGVSSGFGTYSGDNGPANEAGLNFPADVVSGPGGLYIADQNNNRIRRVNSGNMTTVAGDGTPGFAGDGGQAVDCELSWPGSVAFDKKGNLYIADELNNRVREVFGIALGVSNLPLNGKIEVYPNPSPDKFTVTGVEPSDVVGLYDLYGRQVYLRTAHGSEQQIDISKLAAGVYVIEVWDANGAVKTRLRGVKM